MYLFLVPVFNSFEYVYKDGIAGSYGNCIFNFLKTCPIVFYSANKVLFGKKKGSMVNRLYPLTLSWRVTMHFSIVKSLRGPAEKKKTKNKKTQPPPHEKKPNFVQ